MAAAPPAAAAAAIALPASPAGARARCGGGRSHPAGGRLGRALLLLPAQLEGPGSRPLLIVGHPGRCKSPGRVWGAPTDTASFPS